MPERLAADLRAKAIAVAAQNGTMQFLFSSRWEANTRASICCAPNNARSKSVARVNSTLEEVFVKTVNAK